MPGASVECVSVLVVDDNAPFRAVVCELVRSTEGFKLVGEAETGEAAVELAADVCPDLVLMDVRLPGLDGIASGRRLLARHPAATVVLLSTYRPDDLATARESTGFDAVAKETLSRDLLRSVWGRRAALADLRAG